MPHPKPEEKKLAQWLCDEHGLVGAAHLISISSTTLTRVLVGLELRPSTVHKLRAGLANAIAAQESGAE